jgi:ribulose-phosphate 3-epimerase
MKVVPAILAKSYSNFEKQLKLFEPYFDLVQLDFMDGKFVANKTFKCFQRIGKIRTSVGFELHLMVKKPLIAIRKWSKNPKVKRIVFHYEAVKPSEIENLIDQIKQKGIKAGIALNPKTPVSVIKPFLSKLDYALLMSVQPGFGGQKFNPVVYRKIRALRKLDKKIPIGVDGGINDKNAHRLIRAGANNLNVAGYLLHSSDIKLSLKKLSL